MAKQPDREIKPGVRPVALGADTATPDLVAMLRGMGLSFEGAARRKPIPAADVDKVHQAAIDYAEASGRPLKEMVTRACSAYFKLLDERT